jgi:hypothetical protein
MEMRIKKRTLLIWTVLAALMVAATLWGPRACHVMKYGTGPRDLRTNLLSIDRGFDFPPGFPPDPEENGKKTIEGIDSDRDGVRDDVQRWIHALYPDDTEKRMALRQWARFFQHSLSKEFGEQTRLENLKKLGRAIDCEFKVFKDVYQSDYEVRHLQAKSLNTYERTARYFDNDWKVTSEEMSGDRKKDTQPCDNR